MKFLIAGLGNIGSEYELTRHNIGFLTLDRLADLRKVEFELNRHAFKTEFKFKSRTFHLIKPTTYMNLSGKAVHYWMKELKVPVNNILVVVDDIALPFGRIRIREKGSFAGHNGLESIESALDTNEYPRMRLGIGDNYHKGEQVEYVLSRFDAKEFEELPGILEKACDAILSFGTIGIERTMNIYN
jgi:PTH1 family peptidyl-tRNA hydrolase